MSFRTTAPSVYAMSVGSLMIAMWLFLVASGQVPELQTRPVEISLHLLAEFSTAVVLVVSGILSLRGMRTGPTLRNIGLGMLLYTIIVSPGYYLQRNEAAPAVMFAVLLVLTIAFLVIGARRSTESPGGQW